MYMCNLELLEPSRFCVTCLCYLIVSDSAVLNGKFSFCKLKDKENVDLGCYLDEPEIISAWLLTR